MTIGEAQPQLENFPAELKQLRRWLCWKLETRDGRLTKPPYVAGSGKRATKNNPADWRTYEEAVAQSSDQYNGVGVALKKEDGYVLIDQDHCIDPQTGEIADWAL